MVPFKIQYLQAGAVGEDKFYISQKKMPQVNQQVLEDSIRHYLEQLKQKPQRTPETEKALIREKAEEQQKQAQQKQKKKEKAASEKKESKLKNAIIEKDAEGHVKHLDIKI